MKKIAPKSIALLIVLSLIPFQIAFADDSLRDSAGAEQERFRQEEILKKQEKLATKEPKKTEIEKEDQKVAAPSGPRFRMNDVRITGNEEIPTSELQPIVGQLLNRDVNLQEIEDVVSQIKKYYRSKGYVATYVYVPPQRVEQGVIELRIVEGKLGNIQITGNKWFSERVLIKRVPLQSDKPIKYNELKTALSRLNKHRDIEAKAVLKPGAKEGTTDIDVQVKDKFPVHLSTDVNNLGTKNTGGIRWGAAVTHTNVTGNMDQAAARVQLGKGTWAVGSDYFIPVNANDTKVGFSFQHSSVDVGREFKALGVEGDATTYTPYVVHPLIRNDRLELQLNASFDFKEVENRALGQRTGKDSLRILNTGFNIEQNDKWGRTFFPHTFSFGFSNFLGSSDNVDERATRQGSGGQFFIYRTSLIRYVTLPADIILAFRSNVLLSPDRLPPSEQFRLGGAFAVRGYQEGEYLADQGGLMATEIYIPTYFFPEDWKLPYSKLPLRKQIRGVGFFDFGAGRVKRALPGEDDRRALAGFGGGLRIHLFDKVYGRFDWAHPVGDGPRDGDKSKFYFGVSADVF